MKFQWLGKRFILSYTMKKQYSRLSGEEREKIAYLRARGKNATEIARPIGRNKGAISRELRRNKSPVYDVYLANKALQRAVKRKHSSAQHERIRNPLIRGCIMKKLKAKSPLSLLPAGSLQNARDCT
jgi:IS30 family transposase